MNATESLAQISAMTWSDKLTDDVLDVMRLSLLDWASVAIAGRLEPVTQAVRHLENENGGRGDATVIGQTARLPMRGAAMVNGTMAHALDFDDTHFAHIGHPSAVILSAALAMAEYQGDGDGTNFLRAATVGAEASIRAGLWLGRSHYEAGFHQTATAGILGGAVAVCAIFDLPMNEALSAIGLAATRSAGLKLQFGSMGKPYHAGMAAAGAVEAVHAAITGVEGAQSVLDGPFGFGATHHGEGNLDALVVDRFLFPAVSHKYHACCHGTHASIEALRPLAGIDLADVRSVDIAVHPRWLDVCDILKPQTRLEAKFSLRLTGAFALLGRAMDNDMCFEPALILDEATIGLRDRITAVGNATLPDTAARVRVTTDEGVQDLSHDLADIAPYAERQARLLAKSTALIGAARCENLWHAITASDGPDLGALSAALSE